MFWQVAVLSRYTMVRYEWWGWKNRARGKTKRVNMMMTGRWWYVWEIRAQQDDKNHEKGITKRMMNDFFFLFFCRNSVPKERKREGHMQELQRNGANGLGHDKTGADETHDRHTDDGWWWKLKDKAQITWKFWGKQSKNWRKRRRRRSVQRECGCGQTFNYKICAILYSNLCLF